MERLLLMLAVLVLSHVISDAYAETKVIYGEDNRVDVYESKRSDFVALAKSTAAMIPNQNIKRSRENQSIEILPKTLVDFGICKEERFASQPLAANCSGFLVGDKYLVTAGHCVKNDFDCAQNTWVFNYKMINEFEANLKPRKEEVYNCKRIITSQLNNNTKVDYALIELDREVTVARPLKFRTSGRITAGTPLVVIGHPSGLPTKIADNGKVRFVNEVYFNSNLDTYGGNSGSAVFNVLTGEVEGILVRGDIDYNVTEEGCRISNYRENNQGRGEDVTLITLIEELKDL